MTRKNWIETELVLNNHKTVTDVMLLESKVEPIKLKINFLKSHSMLSSRPDSLSVEFNFAFYLTFGALTRLFDFILNF